MYKISLKNLFQNKKRTILAVIGLSIAIVGLISLISLSSGIRHSVEESFTIMGGIMVLEEGATGLDSLLTEDIATEIERIPGVSVVSPGVEVMVNTIDGEVPEVRGPMAGVILGIDPQKEMERANGGIYNQNLIRGSFLRTTYESSVLISRDAAEDLEKSVGSSITLNGETFRVIGIYSTGTQFMDMAYVVPIDKARDMGNMAPGESTYLHVGVNNPDEEDRIANMIEFRVDGIEAKSASQWTDEIGSIMDQMNLFFLGIASIALLVGAIGIINTMLMSVMERTREFGVLKAMGWTKENIVKLVVLESLILGIIGGIVGIILGIGLVEVAKQFMPFQPVITPLLVISAFILSVILGLIGGTYPAWKAAQLDPVEAIRME